MAEIETALAVTSQVPRSLQAINTAVDVTIGRFALLQSASGSAFQVAAIEAARFKISQTSVATAEVVSSTQEAVQKQEEYNEKVESGASAAGGLLSKITEFVGKYANMDSAKKVLGLSDELTQTTTGLDMMASKYNTMNGTMQTTGELSQRIYQSAQNCRMSYMDTAEAVAKLGNSASGAFSSTEEIVGFGELVNKQFALAGLSAQESSGAFAQLTGAMASGDLSGNALTGILNQAPGMLQTLADYMGVPGEKIREMASAGEITADTLKNAMFGAQDEINAKFGEMPMTWGQVGTAFQNGALMMFAPILQKINELANSPQMQTLIGGLMGSLSVVASIASGVFDVFAAGAAFIVDNWSMIAPVIGGVIAALAIYNGILVAHNIYEGISNVLKMLATAWAVAHGKAASIEADGTKKAAVSQVGLNTALLACPLTWIVIAIIAVIAAIYLIVAAVNKATGSTYSATGIIAGLFAMLGASIINTFFIPVQNVFAAIGNFIGNVFNNPIGAVKVLFYDMALTVIGYISSMAHSIETLLNKIPGVTIDITSGIDGVYADLQAAQQQVKDETQWVEYIGKMDFIDPAKAFDTGYAGGQGVENWVLDKFGGLTDVGLGEDGSVYEGYDDGAGYGNNGMTENLSNIANDTSGITDSLDVSSEDLKYLRDIAEQEAINRFTTADINLNMSGMQNTVNNTNDLDGIVHGLTTKVMEAMEVVREGV